MARKCTYRFMALTLPLLFLHEACHYLAARALGANAELHWHYVRVHGLRTDSRRIIFKLAPSMVGVVVTLIAFSFILYSQFYVSLFVGLTLWFLGAWQIMCYADFYDVWFFGRHKRWHPNENKMYSLADAFALKWNPRE